MIVHFIWKQSDIVYWRMVLLTLHTSVKRATHTHTHGNCVNTERMRVLKIFTGWISFGDL